MVRVKSNIMSNEPLVNKASKKKLTQFLSAALAFTTTVSLSGFALLFAVTASAAVMTVSNGDTVKTADNPDVYIVSIVPHGQFQGWKRLILNPDVFNLYGQLSWSKIKTVNQETLDAYQTSNLVRGENPDPKIYQLNPNGDVGTKSWVVDEAAFNAAGYMWSQVAQVNNRERDMYTAGPDITASNPNPVQNPSYTGSGLSVSLASNTPAAGSIVADSTSGDGAQAQASLLAVNFSAGSDGDVQVSTLKVKRSGISADVDISNAYLYDGTTRLAEMTNISDTLITFTSASGLFTVSRGTTRTVWVKMDLTNGTTAGKTIAFSINAASDVMAGSAVVSGAFPVMGNYQTTASVADLGKLTVATVGATSATVDPGQTGYTLWRFSVAAADQKIKVSHIKVTNVGSVATTDLTNIKLMNGGNQLGSTLASLSSDGTATFDLSTPLEILAGQTINLDIVGDIVGGTNRTYRLSIQRSADVVAVDENYGVYLKPNQTDSFGIVQASQTTTINAGSLTISVDPSSPTGNVARDYIDQELARFDFKSNGEAVKVSTLDATSTTTGTVGINNAKLYLDGTQVGSTADIAITPNTTFSFGNSFIIPAGGTRTLVIKGEVKNAAGGSFTAGDTISVNLVAGSANAQGQTSLTSISTSAANGNTLTVQSGLMTASANSGLGDATSSLPTGVKGATGAKIASFVLTAGSGESLTMTQVVLANSATSGLALGNDFQNLRLMNGATQLGTTIGSLSTTASATYSFNPSPAVQIAAGQQYVVDVYADILTGASNAAAAAYSAVSFSSASATGNATNSSANPAGTPAGQLVYIAAKGTLTVAAASDMPIAQNRSMGQVGQTLASFKLTTGPAETVDVSKIVVTDTLSGTATAATGTLINLQLWNGGTQVGTTVASLAASAGLDVIATFNGLSLNLAKDGNTTLTLKGDVNAYPNGTSGSAHTFSVAAAAGITAIGHQSGQSITPTLSTPSGNAQTVYRAELTVANAQSNSTGGASATQQVGKYTFTNTSSGNYTITVSDIDLGIGATFTPAATTNYVTLRRDSPSGTVIAKKGYITAWPSDISGSGWTAAAGDGNEVTFVPFTIDATSGTGSVDVYVLVDTTNTAATKSFSTSITNTNSKPVTWTDGVSATIKSLDNAPITGATISY